MITPEDYLIKEKIYNSPRTSIYRGFRISDNLPVILKILNKGASAEEDIEGLRREDSLLCGINLDGVVQTLGLSKYQNSLALILEDFGGDPLSELLFRQSMDLPQKLKIAIQIAHILGQMHGLNIIHRDINPSNILLNPETDQIKIIDFGISTRGSLEGSEVCSLHVMEGTPAYMAPEQTGRMNLKIDCRTDLYSLGVTLYEIFMEQLPFKNNDSLKLAHNHIAVMPMSHGLSLYPVPPALFKIIKTLMSKLPEERYQSAFGLKKDLEHCLQQLSEKGKIEHFAIKKHDVSHQLQIPSKLFGRGRQVKTLLKVFNAVSRGKSEMLLVAGYPGIGKSALVRELIKPVTECGGIYISGKFDQHKQNVPYSAIIEAFQMMVRQLLAGSMEEIESWREKLIQALGSNGQVIIDVIPEVELIIGKQNQSILPPPTEARNRFNMVFQDFVQVFSRKEHPLTVFLDDLQWADSSSLQFIKSLIADPQSHHLFLIGTCREGEADKSHLLTLTLDEIRKVRPVHDLILKPLKSEHLSKFICETLDHLPENCSQLIKITAEKTGCNPFFIRQFLETLFSKGLLYVEDGKWLWDLNAIKGLKITANVADLMIARIRELPPETQEVLKLASCLGSKFQIKLLSLLYGKGLSATIKALGKAVAAGFVSSANDFSMLNEIAGKKGRGGFELEKMILDFEAFQHDRIREAAYSMIPGEDLEKIHLAAGRLSLLNTPKKELEENIFDVVNHINKGLRIINPMEREQVIRLNLRAGIKSFASTAYDPALEYFKAAMSLQKEDDWNSNYDLTYSLNLERARCEHMCANFETSEGYFNLLQERAKTNIDRAEICRSKVILSTDAGKHMESLEIAQECLGMFGIHFPLEPEGLSSLLAGEKELEASLFGPRKVEELLALPEMEDTEKQFIMAMLTAVGPSAYFAGPLFLNFVAMKMVNLSLSFGNTPASSYAYSCRAIICVIEGDYDTAYAFGKLGIELSEKYGDRQIRSKCYMLMSLFVNMWKQPVRLDIDYSKKGYQYGIESGDLFFAAWSAFTAVRTLFLMGAPLQEVYDEAQKYFSLIEKSVPDNIHFLVATQQSVLNLAGKTKKRGSFTDDNVNEEKLVEKMEGSLMKIALHWYYILKMQASCIFDCIDDEIIKMGKQSEKMVSTVSFGMTHTVEHYFYHSLIILQTYPHSRQSEKEKYWEKLLAYREKLKHWSEHCRENVIHKYYLISAEMEKISGSHLKAMELYDLSVESALINGFVQNAAIANEGAAKFYLSINRRQIAKIYMNEAYYGYLHWGAKEKCREMNERHADLLSERLSLNSSPASVGIDLASLIKASQAISSEIVFEKVLERVMRAVIENAGAQKGFLILLKGGRLFVAAESDVEKGETVSVKREPVENFVALSESIVRYVERTRESVVLNDAAKDEHFRKDPYIQAEKPRSLLCIPIMHQGKLTAILYLENNLTTGAFNAERVEVLQILSSQAAISLINADLYSGMEEFSRKLVESQETERKRIARELHDGLGQNLIAIRDGIKRVSADLAKESHGFRELDQISLLSVQTMEEVREISNFLRPQVLDHLGLELAVEAAIEKGMHYSNINILSSFKGLDGLFSSDMEINVYRIIQEGLTNIIKHSGAKRATVHAERQGEFLMIKISDNGKGFETDKRSHRKAGGFGLQGISERAKMLGGKLNIESEPGKGTTLEIKVPTSVKSLAKAV